MRVSSYFCHIFTTLLLVIPIVAEGKDYTVFSGGKSDYVIVVSSLASKSEQYAAAELKACLEEISGIQIPIVDCGAGKIGKRLIIGFNQDSKKLFNDEIERAPEDESFAYQSKNGDIVIWGGRDRGTMYGVFAFLENELGCRWLAEDCTILPKRDEYHFSKINHSEVPAFPKRSILYNGIRDDVFSAHCRINERIKTSPERLPKQVGGVYGFLSPHTMDFLMPVEKYYSSHPDYFALVDGIRVKENSQPCFSNPDVFRICVEALRKIMSQYPEFSIYEVSALDNSNRCQCPRCQEAIKQLGSYTDLVLDFVNRVADSVKDEFPDKKIEFLAYWTTSIPPEKVKPRDNVVVRLCDEETCHLHGFENCSAKNSKNYLSKLNRWSEITEELYVWEYASNFTWYFIPTPNFNALRDNLVSYKNHGIEGVFIEGNHYSSQSELKALRIYVLTKLLWNPECNFDTVVNDFMAGYYGAAAPYMRQYFDLIHSHISDNLHMTTFAQYNEQYYTEELSVNALSIFEKAKQSADNDLIRQRIENEELSIIFLKLLQKPQESKIDGTYKKVNEIIQRERIKVGSKKSEKVFEQRVISSASNTTLGESIIDGFRYIINKTITWIKDLV